MTACGCVDTLRFFPFLVLRLNPHSGTIVAHSLQKVKKGAGYMEGKLILAVLAILVGWLIFEGVKKFLRFIDDIEPDPTQRHR